MTVQELISKLELYPADMVVHVSDEFGYVWPVDLVIMYHADYKDAPVLTIGSSVG